MIKETSILAYQENIASGRNASQRLQILEFIKANQPCSRGDIMRGLGLPINSVSGRVNGLLKIGAIEVAFKAPDKVTGRKVEYLQIKENL
jgi:predicted transcriptional regulator